MGLSSSISLKTNPHSTPQKVPNLPHSILEGLKRLLLLGMCSCHVVSAKKSPFPSVKMEMEEDVEAAVQGYGGAGGRTPVQPLWQKRVLMGERCEMPRFSGLILYDERGFPLPPSNARAAPAANREMRGARKVALRDIL